MSLTPAPRSKPPSPQPRSPRPGPHTISTVVELNVGGQFYTTTMSTLRRVPGSKLAEMFSSSAKVYLDAEGRFFIDRPGTYFSPILDYLRTGHMPTENILEVYHEAQFYEIQPLVKLLEDTPQIFGEQVARKQFLLRVPGYGENLEVLLRLARAEAVGMRTSRVVVCVVRTDEEAAQCGDALNNLEAKKIPVVRFGPWNVGPDIEDLLYCVEKDIKAQGYQVYSQKYFLEKASWTKLQGCFRMFTFTWW
ncbi:BTB/POZ domain-containing protein KCTD14 isoform X1 [Dipodomys spectabilis]|uniref:BTB/POZ domain-containing protein KCTD14 isoform X1 n=1 Tax=Dipodomys spectabilis TaxID=105255 RepID=UPI001C53950F|nr:BTB/POZ domain-containing protein KCTD14 isoform X1 [Dipodomys spectabilis]